jgi:hypothetical protein
MDENLGDRRTTRGVISTQTAVGVGHRREKPRAASEAGSSVADRPKGPATNGAKIKPPAKNGSFANAAIAFLTQR